MRLLFTSLLYGFGLIAALALTPESTREQIIEELGKPTSVARLGSKEILNFPKGVRLELENGRIVANKGILLEAHDSESTSDQPPATHAPTQPSTQRKSTGPHSADSDRSSNEEPTDESEQAADASYEKMIQTLDSATSGQSAESDSGAHHGFDLFSFVVELGLSMIITVLALKLSCKYWGATVFWSAIFIVAGVDTAIRASIAGLLIGVAGFPGTFYADQAVATLVMFFLLKKLSINHSIPQAVQLTLTTKTFTVVVGLMLISVILQLF